jgi:outer membrane protein assembly factor BamB
MRMPLRFFRLSHFSFVAIFMLCCLFVPFIVVRNFAVAASSATIKLSEISGPPTSITKVTGTGFGMSEQVKILFDAKLEGTSTTSNTGTFSLLITVPKSALPGTHTVKAFGRSSHSSATASFLVQTNWSQDGFDAAQTYNNPYENVISVSNSPHLVQKWSNTYSQAAVGTPIVVNNTLYINADKLYALNTMTGATLWSSSQYGASEAPVVAGGIVYSASDQLYALNANTGALLWAKPLNGGSITSPTISHGVVYVGSYNGTVYAFDMHTGSQLWAVSTCTSIYATPAVANGLVYVGCSDSHLYALDAKTGVVRWNYTTNGFISNSTAIANGLAFTISNGGTIYALNALTGTLIWSVTSQYALYGSLSVAGNAVYVCGNGLFAYNAQSGTLLWSTATSGELQGPPSIANGVVYCSWAGDGLPYIFAFNAATGSELWIAAIGSIASHGSPAIANGVVYIGSGSLGQFSQGELVSFYVPTTISDHSLSNKR